MKVWNASLIIIVSLLSGCVSFAQMQDGLNKIDANWANENKQIYEQIGTRYYNLPADNAHRAMLMTLSGLGLIIEQQDSNLGFLNAKGNAPSPLSLEEWKTIEKVETPRAQALSGLGSMVQLSPSNRDVIVNVFIIPRKNDIQVNIRARVKYTGNTSGLLVGEQAPPSATRLALVKIFDSFEKTAFVQAIVIGKN